MVTRVVGAVMRGLIRGYQLLIAPVIGPRCRHLPSCSEYASEAIEVHGPIRGGWLGLARILRCHPWGTSGYDPVPGTRGPESTDGPGHEREIAP